MKDNIFSSTSTSSGSRRRQLARACRKHGLLIQPAAMAELLTKMEHQQGGNLDIDGLLRTLAVTLSQTKSGPKLITVPLLLGAMEDLLGQPNTESSPPVTSRSIDRSKAHSVQPMTLVSSSRHENLKTTGGAAAVVATVTPTKSWRSVSAFETPKLVYDAMRQQFRYDRNPSNSLMGTAKDLIEMRTQRYDLIRQRVVRHRHKNQLKPIMTIDRLLGSNTTPSSLSVDHVLLGILRRSTSSIVTGCFLELEDMTGSIPLNISLRTGGDHDDRSHEQSTKTKVDPDGIYMDGSVVLVYGSYLENGTFICRKITFPPLEKANDTKQHLPPSPFARDMSLGMPNPTQGLGPVIFCLGGLKLDDTDCLDEIKRAMEKMKAGAFQSILVLFGDFRTDTLKLSSALEEIARVINDAALPKHHSVLLVPGPRDVAPNACWPLPPLDRHCIPLSLREMDNVRMCSNPCRLELESGYSVVLLRKDLVRESAQNQILAVTKECSTSNTTPPPMDRRILHHMLSQGHIMPASASTTIHPIYWNFDHAMRLTPLPDLMIVGLDPDHTEDGLEFVRAGCRVLVPPSRENFDNLLQVKILDENHVEVSMGSEEDEDEEEED
ncbi:DNA polymerase alpha/epsilon subunit B [Nitzschia inconspicua]|uniref:DNA polymerase II subunit 2 n=1 Tax=Nitzschia inconspicua TaxID=303405 RepID=A0A9K3L4Y7_9STRA|nr:DNA polymerase alpha/epsilon subunit B [Nitzschia inconspicua]